MLFSRSYKLAGLALEGGLTVGCFYVEIEGVALAGV